MSATPTTTAVNRHIPVRLADGTVTSVSIPKALYTDFVSKMDGDASAVRMALNEAARTAKPRIGIGRSMAVRLAMEAKINQLTTNKYAADFHRAAATVEALPMLLRMESSDPVSA